MARWLIGLQGDEFDLAQFVRWFPDGDVYAIREGETTYVTGPEFDQLPTPDQVINRAYALVAEMSTVLSLISPELVQTRPVVGSVLYEDDQGQRRAFGVFTARGRSIAIGVSPSGPGPTEGQRLLAAGRRSRKMRNAIELWGVPEPEWWRLLRIGEELGANLHKGTHATKLCSEDEWQRFRASANSGDTSGIYARHAGHRGPPLTNPMTIEDARTFVRALLLKALR